MLGFQRNSLWVRSIPTSDHVKQPWMNRQGLWRPPRKGAFAWKIKPWGQSNTKFWAFKMIKICKMEICQKQQQQTYFQNEEHSFRTSPPPPLFFSTHLRITTWFSSFITTSSPLWVIQGDLLDTRTFFSVRWGNFKTLLWKKSVMNVL